MTRLQKSRALRWLCTLAAAAALVVVLFPVYAIIVGSFESTETLFSGRFYWLPHEATLDNYRTVLQGGSANTQETVSGSQTGNVLTSLLVGLGTALLALSVAVPAAYALSKYRLRVTLVIVLFPVYAIIVGSFESTETLFSGTFYWLPHEATLENYRTVLDAQKGNVLTSLILGVGTALLALAVAVPAFVLLP